MRWLLVSDLDDTLLGDAGAFESFVAVTLRAPDLDVVLNSSRPLDSLRATPELIQADWAPAGMIGALGTEAEVGGDRIAGWQDPFGGFDRRIIDTVMALAACEPHAAEYQTTFKASYAVPRDRRAEVRRMVELTGLDVRIIASGTSNFDVVPGSAGKETGLRRMASILGVPLDATLAAGDSLSDADMLRAARGVVVANASNCLRNALHESDVLYFARSAHAAGVIEGLEHYGVDLGFDRERS